VKTAKQQPLAPVVRQTLPQLTTKLQQARFIAKQKKNADA